MKIQRVQNLLWLALGDEVKPFVKGSVSLQVLFYMRRHILYPDFVRTRL